MGARRVWPHILAACSVVLALLGMVPPAGLVLGPVAFLLAGAALRRLPPGPGRIPAWTGRVLSILVTVVWLVVAVVFGAASYQLVRRG